MAETASMRMKQVRTARGYPQAVIARQLGVTVNYYATVERGERTLSKGLGLSFCEVFSIRPDWLFDGRGERDREISALGLDAFRQSMEVLEEPPDPIEDFKLTDGWEHRFAELIVANRDLIGKLCGGSAERFPQAMARMVPLFLDMERVRPDGKAKEDNK